jgi:hypothetical protein
MTADWGFSLYSWSIFAKPSTVCGVKELTALGRWDVSIRWPRYWSTATL